MSNGLFLRPARSFRIECGLVDLERLKHFEGWIFGALRPTRQEPRPLTYLQNGSSVRAQPKKSTIPALSPLFVIRLVCTNCTKNCKPSFFIFSLFFFLARSLQYTALVPVPRFCFLTFKFPVALSETATAPAQKCLSCLVRSLRVQFILCVLYSTVQCSTEAVGEK